MTRIWFNHWFSTAYHLIQLMRDGTDEPLCIIGSNRNEHAIYRRACEEWHTEPEIRSDEEYVSFCLEFCRQKGLSEKLCMLIGLSVEEMGLNIIRYGFSDNRRTHFLNIRAVVRDSRCVIQFRDNCVSFDPTNYLELHRNNDPVSHFGIRMIMASVKDAIYVNTFGLNNLTLTI